MKIARVNFPETTSNPIRFVGFNEIDFQTNGYSNLLDQEYIHHLSKEWPVTQIRWKCYKPNTKRLLHLATIDSESGIKYRDRLLQAPMAPGFEFKCSTQCNQGFKFYHDDVSSMKTSINYVGVSYIRNRFVYDHTIRKSGYVQIVVRQNRFDCDDTSYKKPHLNVGWFKTYLR